MSSHPKSKIQKKFSVRISQNKTSNKTHLYVSHKKNLKQKFHLCTITIIESTGVFIFSFFFGEQISGVVQSCELCIPPETVAIVYLNYTHNVKYTLLTHNEARSKVTKYHTWPGED